MSDIDSLLTLVDAYCAATGLAEATLSTRVMHDGKRFELIRQGRDIGVRRLAEAVQWFSANWPDGTPWPKSVPRPETIPAGVTP
jgi:hypothetical protein